MIVSQISGRQVGRPALPLGQDSQGNVVALLLYTVCNRSGMACVWVEVLSKDCRIEIDLAGLVLVDTSFSTGLLEEAGCRKGRGY